EATYAANLLFDESALPSWLLQPGAAQQSMSVQPTLHQTTPAGGYSGNAGYENADYGNAGYGNAGYGSPMGNGAYPPQPPQSMTPAPSLYPSSDRIGGGGRRLGPHESLAGPRLIDPGDLPAWLGGKPGGSNLPLEGQQQTGGMSAQSLVDDSALPGWLRPHPPAPSVAPAQLAPPAGEQMSAWQGGGYPPALNAP